MSSFFPKILKIESETMRSAISNIYQIIQGIYKYIMIILFFNIILHDIFFNNYEFYI